MEAIVVDEKRGNPCSGVTHFMSCRMSSAPVTRVAPSRIRAWQPSDECLSMGPGMQNTSLPCSLAIRAVIKAPLRTEASTTSVAQLQPLTMRLRMGKVVREGGVPWGILRLPRHCRLKFVEPAFYFLGGRAC